MAIPPLVLRIYADSSGVRAGVSQTQRQVDGLKGAMVRNSALIKTALIGGVVFGLKKSVDAAIEAQNAQLKLSNSLQNAAGFSKGAQQAFTEQADALRDLTGTDDEAIIGAQAFLIQMKLTEEQVRSLTPLIVDLSAKMGIDLETAAKAVGKSVNGTTGGLQKMGIIVDKTKAKTDAYGATLDALGVAQGFAAKQAENQPWKILAAQFEELLEVIGQALLPVIRGLANTLRFLLPIVRRLGPYLLAAAAGLAAFWTVGKIGALAGAISSTSTAMTALGVASFSAAGPIGIIVGLIAGTIALERNSTSAIERQAESLDTLGYSAKQSANIIDREFNASLERIPGDLRSANMAVYDHIAALESGGNAAKAAAGQQDHYIQALKDTKKEARETQGTLHRFAGMTQKESREWRAETVQNFDAVEAALDNLAGKAKVTADTIIRQFNRQAEQVAHYRENLQEVASRNIPDELLQQLIDMGIGGAAILDRLAGASDKKFGQMIRAMQGARDQTSGLDADLRALNEWTKKPFTFTTIFNTTGTAPPGFDPRQRQAGGGVGAYQPYIVGEHGPEWFVPSVSGTVLPSSQTAAGGATIVFNGDVYGWDDFQRRVSQALAEQVRRAS